jgi:hypothetical protein
MLYTSDYEMIDIALKNKQEIIFDDQWFYNFSDQLGERNLAYSMLDQIIFGCHMYRESDVTKILDNFSFSKIINIFPKDEAGDSLRKSMASIKLDCTELDRETKNPGQENHYYPKIIEHERVLNLPFGFLFNRQSYDKYYKIIREFLGIDGPLICFEYIEFYLSKQPKTFQEKLEKYSQNL